jgi:hypothetical protein
MQNKFIDSGVPFPRCSRRHRRSMGKVAVENFFAFHVKSTP